MNDLRPVGESNKEKLFERLIKYDWIISSPMEKLLLTIVFGVAFYSSLYFLWRWIF